MVRHSHYVSGVLWDDRYCVFSYLSHVVGIEAAASEIEEPFGYDANDIKFDEICLTVIKTLEFMVQNSL